MKDTDILIVIAFILVGVLSMITPAFASDHCEFVFGCPLDLDPRTGNQFPQGRLLEIGRQNVELYREVVSVVWIQKGDQWVIATLHLTPLREDLPCTITSGYRASGCYRYSDESIWILKGWEGYSTKLGCSILWHEILHGQGLSHGEMEQKYDNWVCAV